MREVVVGVDASAASVQAAAFAGRLARDAGAHLTVVHVRNVPPGYAGPPLVTPGQLAGYHERVERCARRRVTKALAPLGVTWDWQVRIGEPAEEIDRIAEELGAEVVAVGSRGHAAVGRALLGSVSTRLAHHAGRPVLVVR